MLHSPRCSSRFALRAYSASELTHGSRSGGQNLAALCTAAGQNLAAVGSSHSLTETMHLGTVTAAGLIGTLHENTPPVKNQYARQPKWPQQHILTDLAIIPEHCNRKYLSGQHFFRIFPKKPDSGEKNQDSAPVEPGISPVGISGAAVSGTPVSPVSAGTVGIWVGGAVSAEIRSAPRKLPSSLLSTRA